MEENKKMIICPSCGEKIYEDDKFCKYCGCNIENALQEKYQKISKINTLVLNNDTYEQDVKEQKLNDALDFLIQSEGNKFKAIKLLKNKYNIDNDEALRLINVARNKIYKNTPQENKVVESSKVGSFHGQFMGERDLFICDCMTRHPNDKKFVIQEVSEKFKISPRDAKKAVEYVYLKVPELNPNGIKKTVIVATDSKLKVGSVLARGAIGSAIFGPVGLLAGVTAKSKNTTTFQVIYNNGKKDIITTKNDSFLFNEYCKYL